MFWTIVILILFLVGVLAVVLRTQASDPDSKIILTIGAIGCFLSGFIVTLFAVIRIVQGYEVGIPVAFGNVGQAMGPGIHLVWPWVKVETYPIRPLAVPDITIKARTNQGGQFTVIVGARWSTNKAEARNLYYQVRTGNEDQITVNVVDKALGQTVQNVYSTLQNADAINERAVVEDKLMAELKSQLEPFGIQANNVFLREVEPDKETAATIAQLTSQQQATKVAIASQQTAEEDAKARQITAEGLAAATQSMPKELTETQLKMLCLQAWERQIATATSKGITLYTTPCGQVPQAIVK
jgi:hypothetical protein